MPFPTYPAVTLPQAEELIKYSGNQLHDIINGTDVETIDAEDGPIPSVRKVFKDQDDLFQAQQDAHEAEFQDRIAGMAFTRVGTFSAGYTLTDARQVLLYETDGHEYGWTGAFPKVVPPASTPAGTGGVGAGAWVDRSDVTLRSDLNVVVKVFESVADMIADSTIIVGQKCRTLGYYAVGDGGGNDYEIVAAATGTDDGGSYIDLSGSGLQAKGLFADCVINPRKFGVIDGVDCASVLQPIQNLSESLRIPVDFSGISNVSFSGKITISNWFHWKSSGRFETTITPLTKSRAVLGANSYGVYAWFTLADPTVSLEHAMLEDVGFDGGYDYGSHSTPIDRLIRAFCWHADSTATHKDITALRVHVKDCPHEFWEGYTTSGGKIDGIRTLFCSASVSDPTTSAVGFNVFKCMNGEIDAPGDYGVYTISNIVSFGNTATGMRTLNDFKRGTEKWVISACETYDMNDCHHSTDGSRYGTFEPSNSGWQTGAARANKNYIEIQGSNIDVHGFKFDADINGSTKRCVAAVLVTDYEYPANGGDGVGNNARQSASINVYSGNAKNINHNAVRFINTDTCSASNITASQCLYGAVSVEYVSPKVDTDSLVQLTSNNNRVSKAVTDNCTLEVSVTNGGGLILCDVPTNEVGGCRVSIGALSSVTIDYSQRIINSSNTLCNTTTNYSLSAIKTDYPTPPIGSPYAFTLDDTNPAAIQTMDWVGKIPLSQQGKDQLYVNLFARAGTSASAALLVQEYTAADAFVSSSFKTFSPAGSWGEFRFSHAATTPAVAYVVVRVCPACSGSTSVSLTGTTHFSNIRISKEPI